MVMKEPRSLGDLLLSAAETAPDRAFLRWNDHSWTYAEFAEETMRVAGGLRELGLGMGDVLGLWTANRWEFILAWFAAASIGAVINPVNPQLTGDEASYIFGSSEATALVHGGIPPVAMDLVRSRCPALRTLVALDEDPGTGVDLAALRSADPAPPAAVAPDHLASLIYTSGTTGRPKGVMLEHRHYLWDTAAYAEVVPYGPGEPALTVLPLFHVNAQVVTTLLPLLVGGTIILAPRFSAGEFWQTVEEAAPAYVSVVPTILAILLETADELEVPKRTSLRAIVVGAAPLPVELFERFEARFNLHIIEGYGLTECTCVASANPYYGRRKIGTIGLPLRGVGMRIIDDDGRELPDGQPGEIAIRGPNVMRGYWRNEEATEETIRDGWLRTGDVGRRDEDGYFTILDRKKDMIIRGGENIYPREVEEVIHQHPGVSQAAVVGIPDPVRGEEVLALVIRRDSGLDADVLAAWLSTRLAAYKRPKAIRFVEDFPRTPTGKVQKAILRDQALPLVD
jgi:long-chain acyl-CoA synthetase